MTPSLVAVTLHNGAVHTATTFLSQADDTGGKGEDFGKSSPLGLLLLVVSLIVVALLIRSMSKHLKRVPQSFSAETDDAADANTPEDESDGRDAAAATQQEPVDEQSARSTRAPETDGSNDATARPDRTDSGGPTTGPSTGDS